MWPSCCKSTSRLPQTKTETGTHSIPAQKAALDKFKFNSFLNSILSLGQRGNYQYCWSCRNSIISFSHLDYCSLLLPFKSLQKERCLNTARGCFGGEFLKAEQKKAEIAMYSSLFSWHYSWGTLLPSTPLLMLETSVKSHCGWGGGSWENMGKRNQRDLKCQKNWSVSLHTPGTPWATNTRARGAPGIRGRSVIQGMGGGGSDKCCPKDHLSPSPSLVGSLDHKFKNKLS